MTNRTRAAELYEPRASRALKNPGQRGSSRHAAPLRQRQCHQNSRTRVGYLCSLIVCVLLCACSPVPEASPLGELYGYLDADGLVYFHADFQRLSDDPALLALVEQVAGGVLSAVQPQLIAGALLPSKTQFVVRTESDYSGTLAALGSARVEKLADRVIRVDLERQSRVPDGRKPMPRETLDVSAAVQIRFSPADLYGLAELAPEGFNLNFIAKTLEAADIASLTIPSGQPRYMRLILTATSVEETSTLGDSLNKSLQFVESVTRATDPSNVWLAAIEGATMQFDRTAVQLSLPISNEILNDLEGRLRLPRTQLGVERAAVLKLGSLRESSKPLTTKENRREETVPYS